VSPVISARTLSVFLGHRHVLQGVSFDIRPGEWIGLVGPNGSGKTTLLRTLAGLLPHDGYVEVDGRAVRSWPARQLARRLAFVRQIQPLSFDFTVMEFVLLGRSPHHGWLEPFGRSDAERVRAALAQVGLEGFEDRLVTQLSGGEQQRARLAQALVQDASLLLLDEPTAHLDVHHQFELMEYVRDLVSAGQTVVSAFHDLPFAARFAQRLLVLYQGTVAADGPPQEVLTPRLLKEVFRMEAQVHTIPEFTIRYLSPA
jgi:iron complex transport system ATP-binding protein